MSAHYSIIPTLLPSFSPSSHLAFISLFRHAKVQTLYRISLEPVTLIIRYVVLYISLAGYFGNVEIPSV
jgi:hypothetical protein